MIGSFYSPTLKGQGCSKSACMEEKVGVTKKDKKVRKSERKLMK